MAAGEYVFHLGRAIEVRGDVTDSSGTPVADARVRVGYASMVGTRETKTKPNGTFSVAGCTPEKIPLTADAKGFATTTVEVDLANNPGPFHLKLAPGKLLRLRVVDVQSNAIPKAFVYLDNQPRWNGTEAKPAPIQADFGNHDYHPIWPVGGQLPLNSWIKPTSFRGKAQPEWPQPQ